MFRGSSLLSVCSIFQLVTQLSFYLHFVSLFGASFVNAGPVVYIHNICIYFTPVWKTRITKFLAMPAAPKRMPAAPKWKARPMPKAPSLEGFSLPSRYGVKNKAPPTPPPPPRKNRRVIEPARWGTPDLSIWTYSGRGAVHRVFLGINRNQYGRLNPPKPDERNLYQNPCWHILGCS